MKKTRLPQRAEQAGAADRERIRPQRGTRGGVVDWWCWRPTWQRKGLEIYARKFLALEPSVWEGLGSLEEVRGRLLCLSVTYQQMRRRNM